MIECNIYCLLITRHVISCDELMSFDKYKLFSEKCEGPEGWCHWHIATGEAVWHPSNQSEALETITRIQSLAGFIGNLSEMSVGKSSI